MHRQHRLTWIEFLLQGGYKERQLLYQPKKQLDNLNKIVYKTPKEKLNITPPSSQRNAEVYIQFFLISAISAVSAVS